MADSGGAVLLGEAGPGVRVVTLNRAGVRNAMTEEMTREWDRAIDEVAGDRETRVLVVTGRGECFSAGADLSWLVRDQAQDVTIDRLRERMLPFYRSWLRPRELDFPVIAAVNGPAVGAGVCLALACDLRFAGPGAGFSTPFAFRGTHGGMAATWLLPEAIGITRARDMLYTGREVPPGQALDWGLVNDIADDALEHSLTIAARIAQAAPIALRLTKKGLEQAANGLQAALQWEALAQPVTLTTSDLHESINAFHEQRTPQFRGR